MRDLTEIRWHARAGQGAKTASNILALALLRTGKSVQSFPEYGPERRGAPLRAYTRYSDHRVRRHDSIEEPDFVVVLDESLLGEQAVCDGVSATTTVLVNADRAAATLAGAPLHAVPTARFAGAGGWIRDITITTGLVDTITTPHLVRLIAERRLDPSPFATHRFALSQTEDAYDVFAAAADTHALKVVLTAEPVPMLPEHAEAAPAVAR